MKHEECLICGALLEYLTEETEMTCALCHKTEGSKTRCKNGHYVCSACHTTGLGEAVFLCLKSESKDPLDILIRLMEQPFCHMHGPEHHVLAGAALLTAFRNAGGAIDLSAALGEMVRRGREVPGGACGFWGACGAGISTGIFISIVTGATPLDRANFALAHQMTARSLSAIGRAGGPRCCKRNSFLSVLEAVEFVQAHLGVRMESYTPRCRFSAYNGQCIGANCPFWHGDQKENEL